MKNSRNAFFALKYVTIVIILTVFFPPSGDSFEFTFTNNDNPEDNFVVNSQQRFKRQSSALWGTQSLWTDLGLPQFWNQYKDGPYGIVIRGWRFEKCASERWTDYSADVTNLVIWPQYPRFPGPIFFNVTIEVKEDLPRKNMEVELEVRHAVLNTNGRKGFEIIPCHGWDIIDGCNGIGSCRYCNILDKCKDAVFKGRKYANSNPDVLKSLNDPDNICPPPKGEWTMTFSQVIRIEDIPEGLFGPIQSNEYWFTYTLTDGKGKQIACARVWMDICKYHLYDPQQKCLRDASVYANFLKTNTG